MFKQVVRPLLLGVLVACASACGVEGNRDELETEPSTVAAPDEVGDVMQSACSPGSFSQNCNVWGGAAFESPQCGAGLRTWSYWSCKQYKYYVGSTAYRYYQECGVQQYACGNSSSAPTGNTPVCSRTC